MADHATLYDAVEPAFAPQESQQARDEAVQQDGTQYIHIAVQQDAT